MANTQPLVAVAPLECVSSFCVFRSQHTSPVVRALVLKVDFDRVFAERLVSYRPERLVWIRTVDLSRARVNDSKRACMPRVVPCLHPWCVCVFSKIRIKKPLHPQKIYKLAFFCKSSGNVKKNLIRFIRYK